MKTIVLVILLSCISCGTLLAQRGYEPIDNEENLGIMYRWKRSNFFNRNSDAALNLRVTNYNETPVLWSFQVGFYEGGIILYKSEKKEMCLLPGQSLRGGLAGLRFTAEDKSLEMVKDSSFSWEFSIFEVEPTESCEK